MSEWILILTIFSADGHAITSIGGFNSRELCMSAGTAWLAQENKMSFGVRYGAPKALCVQSSSPPQEK